jgi:hypothetical protein
MPELVEIVNKLESLTGKRPHLIYAFGKTTWRQNFETAIRQLRDDVTEITSYYNCVQMQLPTALHQFLQDKSCCSLA